jgi:hypothetical protein
MSVEWISPIVGNARYAARYLARSIENRTNDETRGKEQDDDDYAQHGDT